MAWVVSTTPRPFYPRECPNTLCTGEWVGGRAGLDGCAFDPRAVPPVACRYTVLYGRRKSSVRCAEVGSTKEHVAARCQSIYSRLCVEL